jgi:hypothetical protein
MFRQLDQRDSGRLTITLEWDPASGDVQLRCEDRCSPLESFAFTVDPRDARLAFMHPFALRPSRDPGDWSARAGDQSLGVPTTRRRRLFRVREQAVARSGNHDWVWRMLEAIGASVSVWYPDVQ